MNIYTELEMLGRCLPDASHCHDTGNPRTIVALDGEPEEWIAYQLLEKESPSYDIGRHGRI